MNNHIDLITTSLGRLLGATEFAGLLTKDMPQEMMWNKLQQLAALSKEISKQIDENFSKEMSELEKNKTL
jgi:hypothetical protein